MVHSLVLLAGQPDRDDFGHRTVRSATNEPAALRLVADQKPDAVHDAIRRLLRRRRPASSELVLPPGLEADRPTEPPSDLDRCVAAGAVRSLASSHTELAFTLAEDLALNLADDDDDAYGLHAVADVQHSLAVLLVLRRAEVTVLLERTGEHASPEHRERLFGVLERTQRLVDPNYRWRELSDPVVGDAERHSTSKLLLRTALSRVDGTWGEEVAHHAAVLIEELASDALGGGAEDVPSILGALLVTIDRLESGPSGRVLVLDDAPPQLRRMEAASRHMTIAGTGLTRFGGHLPKGGYDVQNGIKQHGKTRATKIHCRVPSRRGSAGVRRREDGRRGGTRAGPDAVLVGEVGKPGACRSKPRQDGADDGRA